MKGIMEKLLGGVNAKDFACIDFTYNSVHRNIELKTLAGKGADASNLLFSREKGRQHIVFPSGSHILLSTLDNGGIAGPKKRWTRAAVLEEFPSDDEPHSSL